MKKTALDPNNPPDLLRIREAAARLAVSSDQVHGLIAAGRLRAVNISLVPKRKQFRVPITAIEEFISTAPPVATDKAA